MIIETSLWIIYFINNVFCLPAVKIDYFWTCNIKLFLVYRWFFKVYASRLEDLSLAHIYDHCKAYFHWKLQSFERTCYIIWDRKYSFVENIFSFTSSWQNAFFNMVWHHFRNNFKSGGFTFLNVIGSPSLKSYLWGDLTDGLNELKNSTEYFTASEGSTIVSMDL